MGDEALEEPTADVFVASLTEKLGQVAASETPAASAAPVETPAPARGPDGKFVAAQVTPAEEGTPSPLSPDAEARLAEKDAFIGRQSNEIGEMRKRLEALEAAKAEPATPAAPTIGYISDEQAEAVVERAGARGAVMAVINDSLDPDSQVFQTVFAAAAEAVESQVELADLVELRLMYRQYYAEKDAPEETPATAPGEDPAVAWAREEYAAKQARDVVSEIKAVTPDFDTLAPFFEKALELTPGIHADIQSGDPEKLETALGTLLLVARGVQATTSQATGEQQQTSAAERQAMLAGAQVAQGSLRPAVAAGALQEAPADGLAAFRKAFHETVTPSVSDGLTND